MDATPSGVTQNLDAVAWTVKHFLVSGEGVTIVSSDGRSWREVKSPLATVFGPWLRGVGSSWLSVIKPRTLRWAEPSQRRRSLLPGRIEAGVAHTVVKARGCLAT